MRRTVIKHPSKVTASTDRVERMKIKSLQSDLSRVLDDIDSMNDITYREVMSVIGVDMYEWIADAVRDLAEYAE